MLCRLCRPRVHPAQTDHVYLSPLEAGGEAGPADQEAREAGPGGRQPGPEWRQRMAEAPPHERDDSMSSTLLGQLPPPHPSLGECALC